MVKTKAGVRLPRTYGEAINDPGYGERWREAIHTELRTLLAFEAWGLTQKPKDTKNISILECKWVFDVKSDQTVESDGSKLASLLEVINSQKMTMKRHSPQLSVWRLFEHCSPSMD